VLFNSFDFALYAALFYAFYSLIGHRRPVAVLAVFSLFFYGYWNLWYLPLIIFSALVDFFCAQKINNTTIESHRRRWLWLAVILNLSILGFFKYWNFTASVIEQATSFELITHELILPIGLSFYTLQTLGYTIDVYRKKVAPERNFILYFVFVSFFPQLVAGPIERANRLLPQLKSIPKFSLNQFWAGFVLVLWGLFIKVAVADNLSEFVAYALRMQESGILFWFVCCGAMFQVYCDFYGYTLIARGLAKGLGINLSENFRQPFFAKTLAGFWQAWHITLTRWIIDYVHIPLARRLPHEPMRSLLTIGVMCLIGLWHGASWSFILFGLFHGVMLRLWNPVAKSVSFVPIGNQFRDLFSRLSLLVILAISAPFFMLNDLSQIAVILKGMVSAQTGLESILTAHGKDSFLIGCILACLVFANDLMIKFKSPWHVEEISTTSVRLSIVYAIILIILIVLFASRGGDEFVYFQF